MKILHIINSLKKGGAEGNLYRLCVTHKKKYKNKIDIIIVTLIADGFYEQELKKIGVKIISLGINENYKIYSFAKKILTLRKFIKKNNPNIIQSWMYHSNFISIFLPKINYNKIYWNIRHSELNNKISKKITIILSIICGIFSRIVPKKIIYCSEKSIKFHENNHFYSKKKTSLINNGYSHKNYYQANNLRTNFRKINKIKKVDIILGYAGRYSKQKNIEALLISFSKIIKNYNNVYLYMAGKNINLKNKRLTSIVLKFQMDKKIFFLDEQKSLLEFYNGIDLLILPSHSESFPNVVAEAMLCSTPVLASDAGCSKKIISKYGFILKKNDYRSITNALKKTINLLINKKSYWKNLTKNARLHIKRNFSLEKMAKTYLDHWIY
jgi:glycosyltransferase involved in cell wall biosynthesis|tara:strand:+ start:286 stop:1431 length:1146 start_codon:yes stop_codon:yes gene_type:complete